MTTDRLAHTYRLLLRFYPRSYRAERGDEIIGTLLEAATPEQRRPRPRDAADLVIGGLRHRLRPPRGPLPYLAAGLVATLGGLIGLAASSALTRPHAPQVTAVENAVSTALSDQTPSLATPGKACSWCSDPMTGADHRSGVFASVNPPVDQVPATLAAAKQRLAADGWTIDADTSTYEPSETVFVATKGELRMTMLGLVVRDMLTTDPSRPDPNFVSVHVAVTTVSDPWLIIARVGGMVAASLIAWAVATHVLHTYRRARRLVRAALLLTGVPVLVLAAVLIQPFASEIPALLTVGERDGMLVYLISTPSVVSILALLLVLPVGVATLTTRVSRP